MLIQREKNRGRPLKTFSSWVMKNHNAIFLASRSGRVAVPLQLPLLLLILILSRFQIPNMTSFLCPFQARFLFLIYLSCQFLILSCPFRILLSCLFLILSLAWNNQSKTFCDEVFEDSYCFTPAHTPTHTTASSTASKFSYTHALVPPHAFRPATAPAPATETAPATNRTSLSSKTSKSSKSSSPDPLVAEGLVTMKRKAEIIGKLYSCYINYPQML